MTDLIPRTRALFVASACFLIALAGANHVAAQTIFSGPEIAFTRAAGVADPLAPENIDQITALVAFARGNNQGIFNAAVESSFGVQGSSLAPTGTRWATDINNRGALIDASNFANLFFTNWSAAYGGRSQLGNNITTNNAVVHLVEEDIYLNLRFTQFSGGGGGGGAFSYVRSTAIPEPGAAVLALMAAAAGVIRRR